MNASAKKMKDNIFSLVKDIRIIVMTLALVGGGGGWKLSQAIWGASPAEHAAHDSLSPSGTPLACTTAMRDMAVNLGKVQAVLEEQGKRMDRFETKIDRINDRLDYRVADRRPGR